MVKKRVWKIGWKRSMLAVLYAAEGVTPMYVNIDRFQWRGLKRPQPRRWLFIMNCRFAPTYLGVIANLRTETRHSWYI